MATVAADTGLQGPALATAYGCRRTDADSAHGNAVLSKEQEQLLVGVAQAFSISTLPLSWPQLQALGNNRLGATVSREWVNRWLSQQRAHLSLRAFKTLADKRAGPQVWATSVLWSTVFLPGATRVFGPAPFFTRLRLQLR